MLALPVSPSMPALEPAVAPSLPAITTAAFSTEQPPALELYDLDVDLDDDEDDDDDDDDDDNDDDDSSDGKLTTDVSLSDDAGTAVTQPLDDTQASQQEDGEEEEEEEEEDEEDEELLEPCPRFYIRIKQFGPYVNYNTLLKHALPKPQHPSSNLTAAPQPPPNAPSSLPSATTPASSSAAAAAATAASGGADGATMQVDAVGAPTAAPDEGGDVLIVGEGRTRRKRQSTQDEYDTNDPFIDDTELPQEREEDDMRTEIEGFHVQIGAVQVKEREVAVKQEEGEGSDERTRKKRQRKEWTKRQIPMSAAMQAQLDKIVTECQLFGGSDALGGSHRRLPDELVELLVQLHAIHERDSAAWNSTERKVLRRNMLERLEAAMGQTREAIRSRMKTAVQRHRQKQLDQRIHSLKESLQKAAGHDYSDFHHRISNAPLPTATKGNVIVHKYADGRVERYEYRPRFSLWMDELLALAAAVVEAAGVQRGEDGRAMEAAGWQVEKELWDEAAGWWGAGVMTGKLIADRVKQARKDRRKKQAQQKQPQANPTTTTQPTAQTSSKATALAAADKQVKNREKEKEKRKRDGTSAVTEEEKKKQKAKKSDGKDAAKDTSKPAAAADHTPYKHNKSASSKQPRDGGKEKRKEGAHKRSVSLSSTSAASSSLAALSGPGPVRAAVFYEPPSGAGRWSDVHFPGFAAVAIKQTTPASLTPSTAPSATPRSTQLTQTQR